MAVGNIEHMMLKVGICTQPPFPLILGFDWLQQVQPRGTYDSNGALCISTPSSLLLYETNNKDTSISRKAHTKICANLSTVQQVYREFYTGSFIDNMPPEVKFDFLTLTRDEAANNVYETRLENRFELHHRSLSFKAGYLVLYDWPRQDHKFSPIFKGPFVIVHLVEAVYDEIV
ncbi:down syndrome cell adhesion molecule-like protein Dscam2 [Trichonephila inaurata madagascariensis]|uniref:Down syndrome cell adhesion molecule-like protein Dscam2 n=1 Tax=Trichonephila inaurata madagascariensis TaxID=2747483 RepID=A0A8X6J2M4_9ARAC|nr:down syndrome cell adhesion molecule-like protein Dscam2 [Trichonephila inaurata madagascariensis]